MICNAQPVFTCSPWSLTLTVYGGRDSFRQLSSFRNPRRNHEGLQLWCIAASRLPPFWRHRYDIALLSLLLSVRTIWGRWREKSGLFLFSTFPLQRATCGKLLSVHRYFLRSFFSQSSQFYPKQTWPPFDILILERSRSLITHFCDNYTPTLSQCSYTTRYRHLLSAWWQGHQIE